MYNNFFFENRVIYDIIWEKYCTAEQATNYSKAHAHYIVDT